MSRRRWRITRSLALLHMISHDPPARRTSSCSAIRTISYPLPAHTTPLCTPATDAASCFSAIARLRVEPRRFPARDRAGPGSGVVGPGVRNLGATRQSVHRPHRYPSHHPEPGAAQRRLRPRRARHLRNHPRSCVAGRTARSTSDTLSDLAEAYKAINAPTGPLGIATLTGFSTEALKAAMTRPTPRFENQIAETSPSGVTKSPAR